MGLEEIRKLKAMAGLPKAKKQYTIPKKSAKKIEQEKKEKELLSGGDSELEIWFKQRHKEMKGVCSHCGNKTQRGQQNYKCSVAHILPKEHFKSVMTHPDNWIELCFYGNSCHTNFDNSMLDLIDMNCFDEVIEKFVRIYPHIAPNERRRIPRYCLNMQRWRSEIFFLNLN